MGAACQVDDLNEQFTFPSNHFDLVHSRLVGGGINKTRWPSYVADIFRYFKIIRTRHEVEADDLAEH